MALQKEEITNLSNKEISSSSGREQGSTVTSSCRLRDVGQPLAGLKGIVQLDFLGQKNNMFLLTLIDSNAMIVRPIMSYLVGYQDRQRTISLTLCRLGSRATIGPTTFLFTFDRTMLASTAVSQAYIYLLT